MPGDFLYDEPLSPGPSPRALADAVRRRVGMGDVQAAPSAQPFDVEAPYRTAGKATGLDRLPEAVARMALPVDQAEKRIDWLRRVIGAKPGEAVAPEYQGPGDPRASAMGEAFNLAMPLHTVFHGTPATWPAEEGAPLGQFRRSFKHTGEGGAYKGAGAYTAEAPPVAEEYREGLTRREVKYRGEPLPKATAAPESAAQQYMQIRLSEGMPPAEAIQDAVAHVEKMAANGSPRANWWQDIAASLRQMKPEEWEAGASGGSLYHLDFPDELMPKVLDFDKPIGGQTPEVREAAANVIKRELPAFISGANDMADTSGRTLQYHLDKNVNEWLDHATGENLYHALVSQFGGKGDAAAADRASQVLSEAGIPAHKFLDQGSRNTSIRPTGWMPKAAGGEGWHLIGNGGDILGTFPTREAAQAAADSRSSRNFVVYEPDKHLKTMARYGSLSEMTQAQALANAVRGGKP